MPLFCLFSLWGPAKSIQLNGFTRKLFAWTGYSLSIGTSNYLVGLLFPEIWPISSPCSRAVCVLVVQAEGQRFDPHSSRKIFLTISVSRDENVPPFIKNGTAPAGSNWKLGPVGLTHHRSTISRPKRVPKRDGHLDITPFCVMPIAYFFFLWTIDRWCNRKKYYFLNIFVCFLSKLIPTKIRYNNNFAELGSYLVRHDGQNVNMWEKFKCRLFTFYFI